MVDSLSRGRRSRASRATLGEGSGADEEVDGEAVEVRAEEVVAGVEEAVGVARAGAGAEGNERCDLLCYRRSKPSLPSMAITSRARIVS